MRPMRRKDRKTSDVEAYQVLQDCEYAVLSTIQAEDGSPYCIPVSPAVEKNAIYIHCALTGQKLENIAKDSRVCLTCATGVIPIPEEFSTFYNSIVITGTASIVDSVEEKIHALHLICKKYASSNLEQFEEYVSQLLLRTAVIKIEINEISGKAKKQKRII